MTAGYMQKISDQFDSLKPKSANNRKRSGMPHITCDLNILISDVFGPYFEDDIGRSDEETTETDSERI